MAFTIHTLPESDRTQQIDCSGLQHPGPNPPQNMLAALPFQHDAIDAVSIEDMGQQHSSWPASDDCHLGPHRRFHKRDFLLCQTQSKGREENAVPIPTTKPDIQTRNNFARIVSYFSSWHNEFAAPQKRPKSFQHRWRRTCLRAMRFQYNQARVHSRTAGAFDVTV